MNNTTSEQLTQNAQRIRDLQNAERERIERERAPQAELAQLQQQQVQLAQQQRLERFQALGQENSAACGRVRASNAKVIEALSAGRVGEAETAYIVAMSEWKAHARTWRMAMQAVGPELDNAIAVATEGQTSLLVMNFSTGQAVNPYREQLEIAAQCLYCLIEWIALARPNDLRARTGLVYCLTGLLYGPEPTYRAEPIWKNVCIGNQYAEYNAV